MHMTPYRCSVDRVRMLSLMRSHPADHVHVVDLPYRLCSWAFDNPDNIGLWEDERGRLVAWAVLQTPFWVIDYGLHPDAPADTFATILTWADRVARALLHSPYGRPAWFVPLLQGQESRWNALVKAGYEPQDTGDNAWSQVSLSLDAGIQLPPCPVKSGYRLRLLRGEAEAAAYVDLHRTVFQSTNMTAAWRREIIRQPAYSPELDLVIEGPDGELVAFCVAWLGEQHSETGDRPSMIGQIEPIGVKEGYRQLGLSWSILAEAVRRLRERGVGKIIVQTDNYRDRAYGFYQAAGFRIEEHITIFRKDFDTTGES